nr:hypothetical protein mcr_00128 [Micrococcus sp.]
MGRATKGVEVRLIVLDFEITITYETPGDTLSAVTVDYQPTGNPKGPPRKMAERTTS